MTIRFTGTSISLFGATPKNDWDVTPIKITVDGGSARTFEGAGYKNPQQYRVQLASVTGLSKEQHTVQVSFFAKGSPGVTLVRNSGVSTDVFRSYWCLVRLLHIRRWI